MYAKNAWKKYTEGNINDVMAFNEEYKKFITNGKTERLCVKQAIVAAEANGFKEINSFKSLKTGDKVYVTNKDKNFVSFILNTFPLFCCIAVSIYHAFAFLIRLAKSEY